MMRTVKGGLYLKRCLMKRKRQFLIKLQKCEKQKYAYVIHTAVAQQAHDRIANITKTLIYQLKEKAEEHIVYIEKLLQESYKDISNSVVEFGFEIPEYKEIKEDFYSAIVQGIKVKVCFKTVGKMLSYCKEKP